MAGLDGGDNLGTAVCIAEFVAGEVEDTEELGETGDSGGLEGAGNRIPTTDPVRKTKHKLRLCRSNFFLSVLMFDAVLKADTTPKDHNGIRHLTTSSQWKSWSCIKTHKFQFL